jgi:hypothetical protein
MCAPSGSIHHQSRRSAAQDHNQSFRTDRAYSLSARSLWHAGRHAFDAEAFSAPHSARYARSSPTRASISAVLPRRACGHRFTRTPQYSRGVSANLGSRWTCKCGTASPNTAAYTCSARQTSRRALLARVDHQPTLRASASVRSANPGACRRGSTNSCPIYAVVPSPPSTSGGTTCETSTNSSSPTGPPGISEPRSRCFRHMKQSAVLSSLTPAILTRQPLGRSRSDPVRRRPVGLNGSACQRPGSYHQTMNTFSIDMMPRSRGR